ncbi:MAG: hypothetical protein P8175_07355 [Deltaproteobacteria bacterium]|jgi:hypothetical protein
MIIEVTFSDIVFIFVGFAVGVIVALLFLARFRGASFVPSESEHAELREPRTLTLKGLESVASIEFNRDRGGRATSVTIKLEGAGPRSYKEGRAPEAARFPEPPTNVRIESLDHVVPRSPSRGGPRRLESLQGKRESVRAVKMLLAIQTDRRLVEKEFSNLHDLKWFMDNFFSSISDRRLRGTVAEYAGPERRIPVH